MANGRRAGSVFARAPQTSLYALRHEDSVAPRFRRRRRARLRIGPARRGGLSLFDSAEERLFIGSPWASYAWGIDNKNGGVFTAAGSATSSDARIVVRVDHMAGDERLRMWLESGGSSTLCYWDDIVIEKGGTAPGTSFCTGLPNSIGAVGTMQLHGSAVVAANNLRLLASGMPAGQFGIFTTSRTVVAPTQVGSGNLCLGGAIGRY